MYAGQLPIFHGPVILPDLDDYLAILNYFYISACSFSLKFDMKMFVNVVR